jgi:hypothetical protein
MSLLIVPLLYPDLAELLNFSHPFQNNFRFGAISCVRSQKLDSMRSRQICEATGRRIAQNNSITIRCSILLATWLVCSML